MPLVLAYQPKFKVFLEPFLIADQGTPLASLVFSEPAGVANWLEPGAPGLQTTARLQDNEWVLNGEKLWATNSGGWDDRGADLSCVVCRCVNDDLVSKASKPEDLIMVLMVTREEISEENFTVLNHPDTLGHKAVNGPHIKYKDVRVPSGNLLCPPGTGAPIINQSFAFSGMRSCFVIMLP